jgi:hypothetical protein
LGRSRYIFGAYLHGPQNKRKKSDFYTLFLGLAYKINALPFSADVRKEVSSRVLDFGDYIDALLKLDQAEWIDTDKEVLKYARGVARAASDRANRVARAEAFSSFVFRDEGQTGSAQLS